LHPYTIYQITITRGDTVMTEGLEARLPKRDLVSTVALLLQTGRLRVAESLRDARALEKALRSFRAKVTGQDGDDAWREGDHGDLVLAVALAAWLGQKAILPCKLEAWQKAYGLSSA
jgi:hypothetical protein